MVKPTALSRVRDHAGHAGDNTDLAMADLENAMRKQQSAMDRLKNARKQVGWIGTATTQQFEPVRTKQRKTGSGGP
jgi:hypothetical protein